MAVAIDSTPKQVAQNAFTFTGSVLQMRCLLQALEPCQAGPGKVFQSSFSCFRYIPALAEAHPYMLLCERGSQPS